jgi:hypothetical protein
VVRQRTGEPGAPSYAPPWQVFLRAAAVITGLTLLLVVDVRGVAFYLAWTLLGHALLSEGAAMLVHRPRAQRRREG